MTAGMAEVIVAHPLWQGQVGDVSAAECQCGQNYGAFSALGGTAARLDFEALHAAHVAEELAKAGYGNVQAAKAEALTDAADWLVNGEAAGIIAYDGPSNRGEVTDSYDAALEDPESWLRERAEAALAVDPAALYRYERDGMADAWDEGAAAGWKQSGEGFNAEYPDESTGEISVDLSANPYREAPHGVD